MMTAMTLMVDRLIGDGLDTCDGHSKIVGCSASREDDWTCFLLTTAFVSCTNTQKVRNGVKSRPMVRHRADTSTAQ